MKRADNRMTYDASEVADLFGIGRNQVYEAMRTGEIPSITIGRRRVSPRAAIHRMLEGDDKPKPAVESAKAA